MAIVLGYYAYRTLHTPAEQKLDPVLQQVLDHTAQVSSYAQYVETKQVSEAGILQIKGDYLVDDTHKSYASYSTTTYKQARGTPVVFLLENRSLGSDVYVRLLNKSPLVKLSVPAGGTWAHFPANSIPVSYQNIAVAGPVIDDLKLLGNHGEYLIEDANHGMTSFGSSRYIRYTFKLSRLAEVANDGGIQTIAGRVGKDGFVDLWIDPLSNQAAYMRLTNGTTYTSTTTFSRFNESLGIEAPMGQ
ncbi:MAG: hypothetical protein RLZZ26_349 [Candidatus Parcubacteria bacterium]